MKGRDNQKKNMALLYRLSDGKLIQTYDNYFNVDLAKNEVLFFSVPFACGFTATIDGSPTNIYKANLCLQALKVPQGKHTIVVTYFPPGLKTGVCISVIGLLLLMLILWSDMREKRRNR